MEAHKIPIYSLLKIPSRTHMYLLAPCVCSYGLWWGGDRVWLVIMFSADWPYPRLMTCLPDESIITNQLVYRSNCSAAGLQHSCYSGTFSLCITWSLSAQEPGGQPDQRAERHGAAAAARAAHAVSTPVTQTHPRETLTLVALTLTHSTLNFLRQTAHQVTIAPSRMYDLLFLWRCLPSSFVCSNMVTTRTSSA